MAKQRAGESVKRGLNTLHPPCEGYDLWDRLQQEASNHSAATFVHEHQPATKFARQRDDRCFAFVQNRPKHERRRRL
jgi:hypothetical protein